MLCSSCITNGSAIDTFKIQEYKNSNAFKQIIALEKIEWKRFGPKSDDYDSIHLQVYK